MSVLLLLSCLSIILLVFYLFSTWKFNYWKNRNVPHLKPTPFFGNYGEFILLRKYMGKVAQKICQAFPDEPYVGAYYGTEPALIVQDPELIKLITTKDFLYFNGREITKYTPRETITQNLFFTYGDRWKLIRQSMSPLFTSSKIKNMFQLIKKCAHVFEDLIDQETRVSNVVEMKELMARYTMDCICSCGFGVETNTMASDVSNNPFKKMGELIFENSNIRGIALVARAIWPAFFYGLGFSAFPKSIANFFNNLLTGVFESRQYKPSTRNDFVDMVLNLKKSDYITCDRIIPTKSSGNQKVTIKVDDEYLVAQCVVFFAAGYETSATTLCHTLYEIAKNEEAQKRAIQEVDEYLLRHKGNIDYECINELPYLEACIDEALRLYPVLGVITREVMEDYTLPTGLLLEKGMRIHLPLYHLHHHPDHFPEPEQYRPERFLPEEKHKIKPYTYLPFGEGPRICIGMRIAKMQMLPGLVTLLKKYRVALAEDTPRTLELDPRAIVTVATTDIHLRLELREDWEQRKFAV